MGLLAKGGDNFDDEFKQVSVDTEPLVCPECGAEVMPWLGTCPVDGTEVVTASKVPQGGPAVPAHLLADLDAADAEAAARSGDGDATRDDDGYGDDGAEPSDDVAWPE